MLLWQLIINCGGSRDGARGVWRHGEAGRATEDADAREGHSRGPGWRRTDGDASGAAPQRSPGGYELENPLGLFWGPTMKLLEFKQIGKRHEQQGTVMTFTTNS